MTSAAPHLVGVVVEGPSDYLTVPELVDRLLTEQIPGLAQRLNGARTYVGLAASKPYLAWTDVEHAVAQRRMPKVHGHFRGEPGVEDARTAVLALRCFAAERSRPAAVLLVRDSDRKFEQRRKGLEQARSSGEWGFAVIIGVADTMRECWVLAAFEPESKREKAALEALRKELKRDPTTHPERLTLSKKSPEKTPKGVLARLTGDDPAREAQCWRTTPLARLRERGASNGLASFMDEVDSRLAPVFAER